MSTYEFDGNKYLQASKHQKEWGKKLIRELRIRPGDSVLDLGCGDGLLTRIIKDFTRDGYVLGIDASEGMISKARESAVPGLEFQHMDINNINFIDKFTIIFSNAALHWIKDHKRLVDNCFQVLKKDGILDKYGRNRLPILTHDNIGKYIIHRSFFDKFIVSKMIKKSKETEDDSGENVSAPEKEDKPEVKIEELTLKEMLDHKDYEKLKTESFFVIAEDDPLSKAHRYINEFPFCLDIFVTKDGMKKSEVTGWITNIIVENESKVD